MMRRLPILPMLLVLVAVGFIIRLGFWQLDRLQEKEALQARYATAQQDRRILSNSRDGEVLNWPRDLGRFLYRRVSFDCREVLGWRSMAGRNFQGTIGYVHIAECASVGTHTFDGPGHHADIVLGWSVTPQHPSWNGGHVLGMIGPGGKLGFKIIADPPLARLQANARPDPSQIPNNHLAYAVQWFLFAAIALVIYVLAARRRMQAP